MELEAVLRRAFEEASGELKTARDAVLIKKIEMCECMERIAWLTKYDGDRERVFAAQQKLVVIVGEIAALERRRAAIGNSVDTITKTLSSI
jgi:hypothetical protein